MTKLLVVDPVVVPRLEYVAAAGGKDPVKTV